MPGFQYLNVSHYVAAKENNQLRNAIFATTNFHWLPTSDAVTTRHRIQDTYFSLDDLSI